MPNGKPLRRDRDRGVCDSGAVTFWRAEYLAREDDINRSIWTASRAVQRRVINRFPDSPAGLLQGELDLLWVPDLAGSAPGPVLPVLRFLVDRWREDLADGKEPDDHCCFTVADIREVLRDHGGRVPSEGTLRKQLTRLREHLASNYFSRAGRPLGSDAVVQHVDGLGYRLRPLGLVARVLSPADAASR